MLGALEQVLLAILLVVLMTGMGATLQLSDFSLLLRRPWPALVGLLSQFGWMPALAFVLAYVLALPPELALGLVIVGATPGGTTSNMFTYFGRGDVALSISMTMLSTVVAVIAMPLLLFVYGRPLGGQGFEIPYGNIVTTLVLVMVPVVVGMVIRTRSLTAAQWTERIGSISGIAVLVLLIGTSVGRNLRFFAEVPARGYAAAILLGTAGIVLGWIGARLTGLNSASRRAVAFETGIQNSPLAFGVILASFPASLHSAMLQLPMLYALFVLVAATVTVACFRAADR